MSKVNEAVQKWIDRFGSNDEDRYLEQATIGKAMAFIVIQSDCGYLDKDTALGFLSSLSNYVELLSNIEQK
jgi:hypothetical protein